VVGGSNECRGRVLDEGAGADDLGRGNPRGGESTTMEGKKRREKKRECIQSLRVPAYVGGHRGA